MPGDHWSPGISFKRLSALSRGNLHGIRLVESNPVPGGAGSVLHSWLWADYGSSMGVIRPPFTADVLNSPGKRYEESNYGTNGRHS